METKAKNTSGVMSALKDRGKLADPMKKGVNLLSIVKKLSEKRKANA